MRRSLRGLHGDIHRSRQNPSFAAKCGAHCGEMLKAPAVAAMAIIRREMRRSLREDLADLRIRQVVGHHSPRKAALIAGMCQSLPRLRPHPIIRRAKRRSLRVVGEEREAGDGGIHHSPRKAALIAGRDTNSLVIVDLPHHSPRNAALIAGR